MESAPTPVASAVAVEGRVTYLKSTFRDALRLATWRPPAQANARMSGLAMVYIFAAVGVGCVLADFIAARGALDRFTPYGVNALLAGLAVEAAIILAFSHVDRTQATTRNLMLAYGWLAFTGICENSLYRMFNFHPTPASATSAYFVATAVTTITYVWLAGVARQALKASAAVRRPTGRAIGFLAALVTSAAILPDWPVFAPTDFNRQTANLWEWYRASAGAKEYARQEAASHAARAKAEAQAAWLEAGQHLSLADAVGKLAPRDPAQANVFTVGVAGWGYQDVFLKEIRQSTAILKEHFKLGDRTLNLINNASTANEAPMASMPNIGEGLRAVAQRMDRDKDLLVLVLSSHGSPDGFALSYENLVERTLDPETLRLMLDAAKIKNRVIIVSSCYSGAFVAPLKNPDTMILTAASADRTSFGCSDDRHWTWFGEALFEKALAAHATLADAFVAAKATIATWERDQGVTPSNPQLFVGEDLAQRFPDIVGKPPAATLGDLGPPGKTDRALSAGRGAL